MEGQVTIDLKDLDSLRADREELRKIKTKGMDEVKELSGLVLDVCAVLGKVINPSIGDDWKRRMNFGGEYYNQHGEWKIYVNGNKLDYERRK